MPLALEMSMMAGAPADRRCPPGGAWKVGDGSSEASTRIQPAPLLEAQDSRERTSGQKVCWGPETQTQGVREVGVGREDSSPGQKLSSQGSGERAGKSRPVGQGERWTSETQSQPAL